MLPEPPCPECNNGAQERPCLRCLLTTFDDAGLHAPESFAAARLLLTQPDSYVLVASPSGDRVFSLVAEAERIALRVEPYTPSVPIRGRYPSLVVVDEAATFVRPDLRVLEPAQMVRQLVALAPPTPESYSPPPPFPKSRRSFKRNARASKRGRR